MGREEESVEKIIDGVVCEGWSLLGRGGVQRLSCDDGGLGDCLHVGTLSNRGSKKIFCNVISARTGCSEVRYSALHKAFLPLKILHLKTGHKIYI